MSHSQRIIVTEAGLRLDHYLHEVRPDLSRTMIQKMIKAGDVLVDKRPGKAALLLKAGQVIDVSFSLNPEPGLEPENIALDIVYEDDDLLIIDKPIGLVTHPGAGNRSGTLANALAYHVRTLSTIGGLERPGIVHRLDKMTSGLLVVAKNDTAHRRLADQLRKRTFLRRYLALVEGTFTEDKGEIIAPLARDQKNRLKMAVDLLYGREARTKFEVVERFLNCTLLSCTLVSGRTHQIRVHLAYIKHPVIGDPLYGHPRKDLELEGQLLHACEIGFLHPRTKKPMKFESDVPKTFQSVLASLRAGKEDR